MDIRRSVGPVERCLRRIGHTHTKTTHVEKPLSPMPSLPLATSHSESEMAPQKIVHYPDAMLLLKQYQKVASAKELCQREQDALKEMEKDFALQHHSESRLMPKATLKSLEKTDEFCDEKQRCLTENNIDSADWKCANLFSETSLFTGIPNGDTWVEDEKKRLTELQKKYTKTVEDLQKLVTNFRSQLQFYGIIQDYKSKENEPFFEEKYMEELRYELQQKMGEEYEESMSLYNKIQNTEIGQIRVLESKLEKINRSLKDLETILPYESENQFLNRISSRIEHRGGFSLPCVYDSICEKRKVFPEMKALCNEFSTTSDQEQKRAAAQKFN